MAETELIAAWQALSARCESPIENYLCGAFHISGVGVLPMAGDYCWEEIESIGREKNSAITLLWAQQKIHHFRVDFIIARYDHSINSFVRLVVECDGHEHHSPIARQRYDNRRDRMIRPLVAGIVHVSGTEIMRNPILVVFDIMLFLDYATARPAALRKGRIELGLEGLQ